MPDGHSVILSTALRQPPSNVEAEQALLGALLANNKAFEYVEGFLEPEHFADPIHGRIYQAIQRRCKAGKLADAVTLKAEFENAGILEEVGGTRYLTQLLTAMVGIINAGDYGRAIYDVWLRRQMIHRGEGMVNQAFAAMDEDGNPESGVEMLERWTGDLNALALGGPAAAVGMSIADAGQSAISEGEAAYKGETPESVSTGLPTLDLAIGRLRMGKGYIIAGRPSMGKTSLISTIAFNAAMGRGVTPDGEVLDDQGNGVGVAIFSLEGTPEDIGAAAISNISGVPADDILSGACYKDHQQTIKVIRAKARLEQARENLKVYPPSISSLAAIRSQVRHLHRTMRGRLKLVAVDYLQRMTGPTGVKEIRLRVAENIRGLEILAAELGICMLVGSQLSKEVDKRADHRPTLADLRETSEIEEAAWVVVFPYREAKYFAETKPKYDPLSDDSWAAYQFRLKEWERKYAEIADKAELIIAKNKRGPAPISLEARFNGPCQRFEEAPPEDPNAR